MSNDKYGDTNKSTTRRRKWQKQNKAITGAANVMSETSKKQSKSLALQLF